MKNLFFAESVFVTESENNKMHYAAYNMEAAVEAACDLAEGDWHMDEYFEEPVTLVKGANEMYVTNAEGKELVRFNFYVREVDDLMYKMCVTGTWVTDTPDGKGEC